MGTFAAAWVPNPLPSQRHRRSLYALQIRGLRDPFFEVFNEPGPNFSCECRDVSNVTPQVFSLFNSPASYDRALALARACSKSDLTIEPRWTACMLSFSVGHLPRRSNKPVCSTGKPCRTGSRGFLLSRKPPPTSVLRTAAEENTGETFSFPESLDAYAEFVPDLQPADVDARTRALADVCLVLLNSNEFAYIY